MKKRTSSLSFISFLFLCMSSFVYADEPAKTPDQLIQNLLKAAQKEDVDSFLSGLTEESRKAIEESYANQNSFQQAVQEFQTALDERFGKGEQILVEPPNELKAAMSRLAGAEVISQKTQSDGSVELRIKTTIKMEDGNTGSREDTVIARMDGASWKLWLGFAPNGNVAAQKIAASQRITEDVRSGKYKDRLSAMIALANAWSVKQESAK